MSELQIVLIVAGVLVVVAVMVINWWQERRLHRQVEHHFSAVKKEAPSDSASSTQPRSDEPKLDIGTAQQSVQDTDPDPFYFGETKSAVDSTEALADPPVSAENILVEAEVKQEPVVTAQKSIVNAGAHLPAMLYPQIDLIALLRLENPISASDLNAALVEISSGYDKPVFIYVMGEGPEWSLLSAVDTQQMIAEIACGLQLADRAGAVSSHTLHRFQRAVESFAKNNAAQIAWQSEGDVLATALALDSFCLGVDKTITFHLVCKSDRTFTGTKLRGLVEAQGLALTADGNFKYFDASATGQTGVASFVMFNRDDYPFNHEMLRGSVIKGVSFQLDIPHVPQCVEAFNHMVLVAKQMASGLNAVLMDEGEQVLGDVQIDKIRQQLKIIETAMLARSIKPGSACAHRLFS